MTARTSSVLLLVALVAGCGRYGPPKRPLPALPPGMVLPGAAPAATPAATPPAAAPTPAPPTEPEEEPRETSP